MAESLFYAVLTGFALGFIYDLFRLFRLVLNDRFFFDFLFWIISAIVCFCYLLIFNNGEIRVLYLLFVLIGCLLVTLTLGTLTKPIQQKLAKNIKIRLKSFKKVLQTLYNIYYNIWVKLVTLIKGGKNGKGSKQKE